MFDGSVPEQFHQFIASRASPSPVHLPPLSGVAFPFHGAAGFDPFANPNPNLNPPPPPPHPLSSHHHHHLLHQPSSTLLHHKDAQEEEEDKEKDRSLLAMSMNFDIERSISGAAAVDHSPWSNEEVIALLRVGSSVAGWFPELTWEHVSRKLTELGFKRSAEKCKEKFEEQTRTFNNNNNNINSNIHYSKNNNNNYRLLVNELEEELYDHHHHHPDNPTPTPPPQQRQQQQLHEGVPRNNDNDDDNVEKPMEEEENKEEDEEVGREDGDDEGEKNMEEVDSGAVETTSLTEDKKRLSEEEEDRIARKRKWHEEKFEMFKRFCESVVERMMAHQEEMHNKLLDDMLRRDREMIEKEEAWKKVEMERVNKELDIRAHEHTVARDRQATIIEFLKRFTSRDDEGPTPNPNDPASRADTDNESEMPSSSAGPTDDDRPNLPPLTPIVLPNPSSSTFDSPRTSSKTEVLDTGKRWPREEVLALINLRCTIQGNSEADRDHQHPPAAGNVRAPLWERISQAMSELGYKRSAKRCKEKWENINKYFRKTKDSNVNKKRSLDSRTCPYFHQLSTLYNQGKLEPASAPPPEDRPISPENRPGLEDIQ